MGLSNVQYTRGEGLLYISKAQRRALTGVTKISNQGSSVKGVGVCEVYHNTLCISEDII